jgi:hypothetical protein
VRREKQIAAGKRGGRSQAAGAGESGRRKRVRREKRIAAGERALTGCRCGGEREAEKSEV